MARRFVLPRRVRAHLAVDFERDLNPQQLAVVTCGDGPKLVIAGAGTGKTRTLTYRAAYLLAQGVPPDRILLVTFTNKAAREMLDRVHRLTGLGAHELWGGTFHAVGARILRRHAGLVGYSESFSILDEEDQRDVLKLCITDLGVAVERRRFPSPGLLAALVSLNANTRTPLPELVERRYPHFIDWVETIEAVAERYAQRKRAANGLDYDDLLRLWLQLLREHPEVRRRYGEQFRHILVDEYQDTNVIQAEIVEELAAVNGGNLMVVGDDCQSIYAFRGANYDNILRFPERNPETEIFKLEINYRSTPQILALTNASIRHNRNQYHKTLRARRRHGAQPAIVPCSYPEQEATFVAERILQLRDEGVDLDRIAVLYRAHSHRLVLETVLLRYDIPYEVRGGLRFFEQAHIKDVVAYLRLVENPQDEVAFRRVVLMQPGVGNVTAERLWQAVRGRAADGDALVALLAGAEVEVALAAKSRPAWRQFVKALAAVAGARGDPEAAIRAVVDSAYEDYALGKFDNPESRLEDIEQLALFASQYGSVRELLEELVLLGELYGQDVRGRRAADEPSLILSTVHQAKGLEWDVVFLIHLVEGALPNPRALEEPDGEEEERRIFYVAMTRARDELYLTYPILRPGGHSGALVQQPSRFLQELPEELYEVWRLEEEREAVGAGGQGEAYDPNLDPPWEEEAPGEGEPWDPDPEGTVQ